MTTIPPLVSGGLMLSYACPCACRHCLYRCGPGKRDTWIDEATLARIFAAFAKEPRLQGIHLAGGEATLRWELLEAALRLARAHRVGIDYLETNGHWCIDLDTAMAGFERLRAAGLGAVLISASLFHNEFIPFARTRVAVQAAQQVFAGRVIVWTHDLFERMAAGLDPERTHTLAESCARLGIDRDGGELWRVHGYLTPGGRAAETLGAGLARRAPEAFAAETCGRALDGVSHFHVDPYGNLFTGLCPGVAPRTVFERDRVVDEASAPLTHTLRVGGPTALAARATAEAGFVPDPVGYISGCHLCFAARKALHDLGQYPELRPAAYYQ